MLRQLAESRDSLQFSNHLCEQLEGKVEELEASNEQLTKLCREKQALLEQRSSNLAGVEEDLASARDECDHVRADLDKLRRDSIEEGRGGNGRGHTSSCDGEERREREEMAKVREEVEVISLRVQSSDFQKRRLEREMANVLGENATLSRNLEKAESELAELQLKFHEFDEGHTQEEGITPHSVTSPNPIPPASPHPSAFALPRQNSSAASPDDASPIGHSKSEVYSPSRNHTTNGQSLFSELDTQYSSLQQSYGDLLHKCTCSASLGHTTQPGTRVGGGEGVGLSSNGTATGEDGPGSGGAFKELFEEMFATLRQTAEVADRLIEKRKAPVAPVRPVHS